MTTILENESVHSLLLKQCQMQFCTTEYKKFMTIVDRKCFDVFSGE